MRGGGGDVDEDGEVFEIGGVEWPEGEGFGGDDWLEFVLEGRHVEGVDEAVWRA